MNEKKQKMSKFAKMKMSKWEKYVWGMKHHIALLKYPHDFRSFVDKTRYKNTIDIHLLRNRYLTFCDRAIGNFHLQMFALGGGEFHRDDPYWIEDCCGFLASYQWFTLSLSLFKYHILSGGGCCES